MELIRLECRKPVVEHAHLGCLVLEVKPIRLECRKLVVVVVRW